MPRPKATKCKRGHEYTPENTIAQPKGKLCRKCRNDNAKIRYNANPELRERILLGNAARRNRRVFFADPIEAEGVTHIARDPDF